MPTVRFALEAAGPERLAITTPAGFKRALSITLDGQPLFADLTFSQLSSGLQTTLHDGTKLFIKVHRGLMSQDFEITHNGKPIPGSIGTPGHAVKSASDAGKALYAIAIFNLLVGLAVMTRNAEMGIGCLLGAALFAVLGLFVKSRRSVIALGIAITLFTIDGLYTIATVTSKFHGSVVGGAVVRGLIIVMLGKFFLTMWKHRASLRKT